MTDHLPFAKNTISPKWVVFCWGKFSLFKHRKFLLRLINFLSYQNFYPITFINAVN
jgi:hypothetical protein